MSSRASHAGSEYSRHETTDGPDIEELSEVKSKQVGLTRQERSEARHALYKLLFCDWLAIVGILPSLGTGAMPPLLIFFVTDCLNALQDWMTSVMAYLYSGGQTIIYDPMPAVEAALKKMAGVIAAMAVFTFLIAFIWIRVGSRVIIRLKDNLFTNMMKSDVTFFDTTPVGNVLTLLSEDAESVQLAFGRVKGLQIGSLSMGVISVCFGLSKQWSISLISLIPVPLLGLILTAIVPGIMKHSALRFQFVSESMTIAEETLSAVRTVKGFNREDVELGRFMKATSESSKHDTIIGLLITVFLFSMLVIVSTDVLSDFYYAATFVRDDKLGLGDVISIFIYTMLGSSAIISLQGTMQGEQKAIAAGARILRLTNYRSSINFDGGLKLDNFQGHIEFKNVSFKYPTRDAYVLKNVSFVIQPRQIGALVGHSGSGKSTCVQLLERFYDCQEGQVLLDGVDIKDIDPHWLHQKVAIVSQEPTMFRMSVKENLKYGACSATDAELAAALEIANATRIVSKLDKGINTLVGDKGSSLSGGQKQRIAIARAVVKNPTILITDEATSALDAQSEKKVQIALDRVMETCTGVIVAHRLSTIRNAQIIYVFDAGEIKESGTHNELVEKGEWYYNLVKRQLTVRTADSDDD